MPCGGWPGWKPQPPRAPRLRQRRCQPRPRAAEAAPTRRPNQHRARLHTGPATVIRPATGRLQVSARPTQKNGTAMGWMPAVSDTGDRLLLPGAGPVLARCRPGADRSGGNWHHRRRWCPPACRPTAAPATTREARYQPGFLPWHTRLGERSSAPVGAPGSPTVLGQKGGGVGAAGGGGGGQAVLLAVGGLGACLSACIEFQQSSSFAGTVNSYRARNST